MHDRVAVVLDFVTNDLAFARHELRALRDALNEHLAALATPARRTLYLPGERLPDLDAAHASRGGWSGE